jgi:hypothetical protein
MDLDQGATAAVGDRGVQRRRRPAKQARSRRNEGITVPHDLRGAHPIVKATRNAAIGLRPGGDGLLQMGPQRGVAQVGVSRPLLRRAILILHGLTKEALGRGWGIVPHPEEDRPGPRGIAIKVGDHSYPVELRELTEQLPLTARSWSRGGAARSSATTAASASLRRRIRGAGAERVVCASCCPTATAAAGRAGATARVACLKARSI